MIGKTFLRKDIAIDLGTANTLIFVKGQGIVLNEPSVLAVRHSDKEGLTVIATGHEAKSMLGRAPENITAARPLKDGVITDFTMTAQMVKAFIDKAVPKGMLRPAMHIVICVPCDSTQVERRAIREAAMSTGAAQVYLIEEPMAAALGAGLPVSEATGSMVIDIGAGTTGLTVLSLGGVVYKAGIRVGGDCFDEAIVNHVRRQHGILIGERTAERIKMALGDAMPTPETCEIEVGGQKLSEGVPRNIVLSSTEIREALAEPLSRIVTLVKNALEQMPAELASDIAEHGILVTGGGALLRNIDQLLKQETGLSIRIADDPLTCVARGCGMALDNMAQLPQLAAQEE